MTYNPSKVTSLARVLPSNFYCHRLQNYICFSVVVGTNGIRRQNVRDEHSSRLPRDLTTRWFTVRNLRRVPMSREGFPPGPRPVVESSLCERPSTTPLETTRKNDTVETKSADIGIFFSPSTPRKFFYNSMIS